MVVSQRSCPLKEHVCENWKAGCSDEKRCSSAVAPVSAVEESSDSGAPAGTFVETVESVTAVVVVVVVVVVVEGCDWRGSYFGFV